MMPSAPPAAASPALTPPAPTPPMLDPDLLLRLALGQHRAGGMATAMRLVRAALTLDPARAPALLLASDILGEDPDPAAAIALLSRYTTLRPGDAVAENNLGVLHLRRNDAGAATPRFRRALTLNPAFDRAAHNLGVALRALARLEPAAATFRRSLRLRPDNADSLNNLAELHHAAGSWPEALAALDRTLALDPGLATSHCNRGILLAQMQRPAEAEAALRRALVCAPGHVAARLNLALALEATGRQREAQRERLHVVRARPLVHVPCLGSRAEARLLVLCCGGWGNLPTEFLFDRRRLDRTTVYLLPPDENPPAPEILAPTLPAADVVFNAIADADHGDAYLAPAGRLCAALGRPVLNPPDRIARTRRDRIGAVLAGIPGLCLPEARRLSRAALSALPAADWDAGPLLLRPAGSHGGTDMERLDHPAALAPCLETLPGEDFYLTRFAETRGGDGHYRKYRFIFVDRVAHPYHLAIMTGWKVHYWRTGMSDTAWMRQEEEAFLAGDPAVFPAAHGPTLAAIAQRLDLDYAGIDCAVAPDGRLVLFEANAAMLVHQHGLQDDQGCKKAAVTRIVAAVADMITRRARPRGQETAAG